MSEQNNVAQLTKSGSIIKSASNGSAVVPETSESVASILQKEDSLQNLSTDEQMALYEKELKENDWGHQPC